MNKSTDNNFQWDDNLVKDFTEYVGLRVGKNHDIREQINYLCEDFKQSKLPSQPTEQTLSSKGEREWEIMSYTSKTNFGFDAIMNKMPDGKWALDFRLGYNKPIPESALPKDKTINSVKRLSDNVVFQVGDDVYENITGRLSAWTIKEFSLKDERCFSCGVNINNIEKQPYPETHANKESYPITKNDDKVTREELLEAESKAFYAARETKRYGFFSEIVNKYPTFSDYKDSQK